MPSFPACWQRPVQARHCTEGLNLCVYLLAQAWAFQRSCAELLAHADG